MNYCNVDDLLASRLSNEELIQLTDDAGTGSYNQDFVQAAIVSAQELIDGYLRGRLALPLNPVPGVIKNIAVVLAAYNLFRRRLSLTPPEQLRRDYDDAISTLERVQKGIIAISPEDASRGPAGYKVNKTRRDRQFGKDRLEGY